jgi:TonB family protein
MFDTLIESRPSSLGLSRWGLVGAVGLHVAAVSAWLRTPQPALAAPPTINFDVFLDVFPPEPASTTPAGGPVVRFRVPPPVDAPISALPRLEPIPGLPELTDPAPIRPDEHQHEGLIPGMDVVDAPLPVRLVQELPELLAGPPPVYPRSLREMGVEGLVVIQVVVDTLGRPEPGSVRVVRHDAPGFETSAVASIRGARFRPARVWGRAVRVLVQVPVEFRLRARR